MNEIRSTSIAIVILSIILIAACGCVDRSTSENDSSDVSKSLDIEKTKVKANVDADERNDSLEITQENSESKMDDPDKKQIEILIRELEKGNHENRLNAAESLGDIGKPAVEALVQNLSEKMEDPDQEINNYAILALIKTEDEKMPEILGDVLKNKTSKQKKIKIENENEEGRTKEFLQAVEEKDAKLRNSIAIGVKEYDQSQEAETLAEILNGSEQDADKYAELALNGTNISELTYDEKVEMLIKALKCEKGSTRVSAIMALGEMKEERALDRLIWVINIDNPSIRDSAAMAMGNIGNQGAVVPLLCTRRQSIVSGSVVMALGKLEDETSFFVMEKTLRSTEGLTQSSAALALGYLRGEKAAEPLIIQLKKYRQNGKTIKRSSDVDKNIREDLIIALAEIKDKKAVECLTEILEDKKEDEKLRILAAFSVGEIRDIGATSSLLRVINDETESEAIRKEAIYSIGKIEGSEIIEELILLLDNEELRPYAYETLIKIGKSTVDPLIEVLESGDKELKNEAALLLIEIGDERAVDPLIETFSIE
ncbi:MAG: HEAT repeat domain-containing protein [Methanosarcinaceae archaeon]|nr:HEAT repeat domain-containing protein [Methanosarcinaceae archaeon]